MSGSTTRLVFVFSFCLLPSSIGISAEPTFVVNSTSAAPATGSITRIGGDGNIVVQGGVSTTIAGADLISLRQSDQKLPPPPAGSQVVFANGDCVAGEVLAIENDVVRFKAILRQDGAPDDAQEFLIPQSALSIIWFQSPPASSAEELTRGWARERRRRDMVLSKNGDTRSGVVKEMKSASKPLLLHEDDQDTRIDPFQLLAIVMNTDLARILRPRGQYLRLVLANGGRLSLLSATADEKILTGKTLFGAEVKIPLEQIVAMDVRQGKAMFLSDLRPKSYEHTSYLGVHWPYEMDRCVSGKMMRLAGNAFDKGIGMHSQSRLVFDLGGGYRRFEALVGLDDRTGQGGLVKIRVVVDGKDRDVGDTEISSALGPRSINIDVSGGKELTLVVEFGSNGDVRDHVDWADARLVK